MRKLASVQRIKNLEPIEGKNRIELATILGWQVIVGKGDFEVDDLCVYIEIDSLLPEIPEFEFLRSRCYSKKYKRFKIKTMKMAGIYSQGIAFPLESFPSKFGFTFESGMTRPYSYVREGDNVTKDLNIIKYDPELEAENNTSNKKKKWYPIRLLYKWGILKAKKGKASKWPEFLVKTDETRLQAIPKILDEIKDKEIYVTAKLDGSSATYYYKKYGPFKKLSYFGVCSRNLEIYKSQKKFHKTLPSNIYWEMEKKYNIGSKLKRWCDVNNRQIALQGEICGEGIQKNRHKIKGKKLFVYQIYDIEKRNYVDEYEMKNICVELGVKSVPYVVIFWDDMGDSPLGVDWWIKFSHNIIDIGEEETLAEGIVVRTTTEQKGSNRLATIGNRLSFKVVDPEYLIKHNI